VGRGGAVLSPILAGMLFDQGAVLPTVGMIMAAGSLFAALMLFFLKIGAAHSFESGKTQRSIDASMAKARA
jgi:hypothetical protein